MRRSRGTRRAGGRGLRPAPSWAAGAFLAEPGWDQYPPFLAFCQLPHGRARCREARELGLVQLEKTCTYCDYAAYSLKKRKQNKTCLRR